METAMLILSLVNMLFAIYDENIHSVLGWLAATALISYIMQL